MRDRFYIVVDGHRVTFDAEDGWRCDCADFIDEAHCDHCERAAIMSATPRRAAESGYASVARGRSRPFYAS